ncbi:MAG: hypothetical protein WBG30_15435 [Psychrilyobacter sp.]|uniref:hypothetical protein n=1 Tax=Psychrilyobacter sp. TaxID=2586924 RepID=UPI003C7277C3
MKRYKLFLLFILLIFIGCTPKEDFVLKATPSISPAKLAILPINNNTNDVAGGFVFRGVVYNNFEQNNHEYDIQDTKKTDKLLNEAGITDGGQLRFLRPIELAEILGVDGLLYIDLDELDFMTYPYYHTRSVKGTFLLYNFEKLIWVKPIRVAIKYFGVSSALNTVSGAVNGDSDKLNDGMTQAGIDIAIHQGIKYATIAGFDHELAPEMALVSKKLSSVIPKGSRNNLTYVKQSENEIKYLKEKISKKESIVTDEMYIEVKEKTKVLEEIIPILN